MRKIKEILTVTVYLAMMGIFFVVGRSAAQQSNIFVAACGLATIVAVGAGLIAFAYASMGLFKDGGKTTENGYTERYSNLWITKTHIHSEGVPVVITRQFRWSGFIIIVITIINIFVIAKFG